MQVRRLDHNHDWTFGNGINSYCTQSEAVAQMVKTRLWSFANDWFLDLEHGLPWLEKMGKAVNLQALELRIKRQVLETQGVKELTAYQSQFDAESRSLTVSIDYVDIYGQKHTALYRS